ncbi:MAG: TIGR03086 family metal-binding protein [Ilumatobacter sp.]
MTNTQIHIDYTNGAPLASDDPRGAMARSVQAAQAVLGEVTAAAAHQPTPCADWDVLQLCQHMIAVLDRAAAGPTDDDINALPVLADVPLDELGAAALTSAQRVHENWSDEAAMSKMIAVPWGEFPGAAVIGVYAGELLLHTWDLAVSLGIEANWPETDVAIHLQMAQLAIPEDGRNEFVPFGDVVACAETAPTIERLAAWQGRDVSRWSHTK